MADVPAYPPYLSLSAVSGTGAGAVLDNVFSKASHSIVVTTSSGVSAGTVVLEGSQDGSNWVTTALASVSTTAATTTYQAALANTPLRFVRARVTVGITGGTITAYVASA